MTLACTGGRSTPARPMTTACSGGFTPPVLEPWRDKPASTAPLAARNISRSQVANPTFNGLDGPATARATTRPLSSATHAVVRVPPPSMPRKNRIDLRVGITREARSPESLRPCSSGHFGKPAKEFFRGPSIARCGRQFCQFGEELFVSLFEIEASLALHPFLQFGRHALQQLRAHIDGHQMKTYVVLLDLHRAKK